ncbi:protein kinase domain-containing protein [Catellatospora tritici]|uniref:protein kinase domain-containing protein n=1 Tax=Catellatospora tritici TaxID=2851566 RepID=UPI001C2DA7C5|nr:protein kinase [Catellatospora tritici]MBV1853069.1 protein kinase [Catellatospora tritici]
MLPPEIELPERAQAATLVASARSRVWRVRLHDGRQWAVKYAVGQTRHLPAREAGVLAQVGHPGYLCAHGDTEHGAWIALQWLDAPTLYRRWQGVRGGDSPAERRTAAVATWSAAVALADLHDLGWRHAGLHPEHVLVPARGTARLLDYAHAQHPDLAPATPWRGGPPQLTAPETARELLDTGADHHVELAAPAEVYAFGALLYAAWTGRRPYPGGTNGRGDDARDTWTSIATGTAHRPVPDTWPAMATLLTAALAANPADRPTFRQLAAALTVHDPA